MENKKQQFDKANAYRRLGSKELLRPKGEVLFVNLQIPRTHEIPQGYDTFGLNGKPIVYRDILKEAGVDTKRYIHEVNLYNGDNLPTRENLRQYKAIILSGSGLTVYKRSEQERQQQSEFIQSILSLNIPTLALCYGMQLVTEDCGGTVEKGSTKEHGVANIHLLPEGKTHPVFRNLLLSVTDDFQVFTSHSDICTKLPKDAKTLATDSNGIIQAYQLGSITCVQFHPELSPAVMLGVLKSDDMEHYKRIADIITHLTPIAQRNGRQIINNFMRMTSIQK